MAHAQFHKNQRVYVRPVGTWAIIERVVPQWTKGLEAPIRIFYDVGLGREFGAEELQGEPTLGPTAEDVVDWRIARGPNKWQSATETATHPYPGTHPVIVTGDVEWGGWRIPGAEYALSPDRVEKQARMIACTPRLVAIAQKLHEWAQQSPTEVPESLHGLVQQAADAVAYLTGTGQ